MSHSKNLNEEFMKSFLDLPKLFTHIKKLNRGDLYRLLPYVVQNYNKDWTLTLDNNTYNDIRRFVSLLKVYKIKHDIPKLDKYERNRKFVAHMFSSIAKTSTRVEGTIGKVDDLVDKMHAVLDSSSEDIRKMFSNLNSFTSLFVPSNNSWTEIIAYITKFAAFGYLLSCEQNRTLSNVVALLTLILPTGVGDCIMSSLNRAIQGIWDRFKKSDELVTNAYEDDNTIVAFFKVTVHLMKSMFTQVPMEHFKNMQISVAKIKMIADYLKNSNTIFEYIMKLFQKTLEVVGNKLLKYYGKLPKLLQQENLNDLIDRYVEIKENKLDVKANTNSYIARQVLAVYNDALKAQAKLVKTNKRMDFNQSKLLAYLNIMVRNLEPIVTKIPDHIKGTKNARRTKPFWLYIYGEPRIGKTAMFQPYVVNAVARCCNLIDKYQDYSEYTYFRNCGDEYWEKYCGQPVLWYNDLFQVFTNEQKVNIGIEEITNVVDDNLYPLNMAFEEKHNVYFDSQFVISNAQSDLVGQSFVSNKCLSSGEHIYSRRNMVVRLRVDSSYKLAGGLNYNAIDMAREAGVPFVGDLFPANMYLVDFMDPVSGIYLKTVSFTDSIRIIVNAFESYKKHQNNFKEKLFNHFQDMWAQSNDTWQDALYQASVHQWNCTECEDLYNESEMLNDDERDEIRATLLMHCPHKIIVEKNRWKDFGEMIKVNVEAFWDTAKKFMKNNYIYILLSAFMALMPIIFVVVNQYFGKEEVTAFSAETNVIRGKKQVTRLVTQEFSQQNRDIETKLIKNMAMVYIKLNYNGTEKKIVMGSSLGVGGDIFMMPRHFQQRMEDFAINYGRQNITIELMFLGNQIHNIKYENIKDLGVNYEHLADIIFLQFPKVCCLPKIDRFFVNTRDEPVLYESYLFGRRVDNMMAVQTLPVSNVSLTTRSYTHPEMELPIIGKFIPSRKIVLPEGYEFKVNNVTVGDCGMLLLNTDEKMNARKIMGVHVAGSIKGNIGLASAIYAEDIQAAYENANMFISMENVDFEHIDEATSGLKYSLADMFNICGVVYKNDKKVKLSIPMKTSLSKSVFFDLMKEDFGENKCLPARLRPFTVGDVKISPMLKGLGKMTKVTNNIRYDVITTICNNMYASIMSWDSKYQASPRLLSLSEAINGLQDLNKIDITTSAGFPYQLTTKLGGKRDWFEIKDNVLVAKQDLLDSINKRLELAKNNIICETFFVDTLKDELRPIEKVLAGKTRVFQVGPMCLSILMRQYFGYFIMHCQTTYINGEMGIGINPNSYDWTLLIKRLLRVGSSFINGDYSDYDASMSQPIMMHICDVINDFYGVKSDHEDSIVRRVLMATFLNNVHIVEDVAFMRLQGNMSGVALTTIVNCLYNMFLLRYAYYKLVSDDFTLFTDHVSATFYGDDNLVCIADEIKEKLNMITYCDVMAELGITYTTADKTEMTKPLYNIEEISYLKRSFVKRANIYYAPLEMDTIMEIPRWSESDPHNMMDQLNRFNCVLYELVNYGFNEYNMVYKIFLKYILYAKNFGYNIQPNQLLSYNYILRSMFPQFFSCDLTQYRDQVTGMLSESGSSQTVIIGSNCLSYGSDTNFYNSTTNLQENDQITQSAEGSVQRAHVQVTRQMVAHNYELRDFMDDIQYPINFSDEFKFQAMANPNWDSTAMAMDQNAGETVEQSQISTTFDDTIPHVTSDGEVLQPFHENPYLSLSLESFINREWFIARSEWKSDTSRATLFKVATFPTDFMTFLASKLANIAYWAPDFELTFRVNGTPMHYGRIMFAVVPHADILHESYLQPQNFSQHRFIQLSPTGNQSVKLKVPWMHFYDRIPCSKKATNISTNPWTLYSWVAAPLLSSISDTVAPVTISIFGKITNPRFTGYTNVNLVTEDDPHPLIAQSSEQQILSTKENVAAAPKQTGIFPLPSTIGRTIEKVAGDMSQLAEDVGFANGPNLTATKPVIFRNMSITRAEDLPTTIMLGPSQSQFLTLDDATSNAQQDGMRLAKIAGRMSLLATVKITSATAVGDAIIDVPLHPVYFRYSDYDIEDPANTLFPLPASYLARMFRLWRGSFKFHVSFICSAFHSMRVRMNYQPFIGDGRTLPTESTSAYNVNQVWDINNQTDYSFRVPFLYLSDWCPLSGSTNAGQLIINTLTKLTSTTSTPQPIFMQVWVGMDDDFQLAYPILRKAGLTLALQPTMNYGNPDIGTFEEDEELRTQSNNSFERVLTSGNPMLNYRSMQFPCMSSDGLDAVKYPTLGGCGENKHKSVRVAQSFEFASAKELVNMLTPVERQLVTFKGTQSTTDQVISAGRTYMPYAWMNRGANDSIWNNYLCQMMAIFRYARGSVRVAVQTNRCFQAAALLSDMEQITAGRNIWVDYTADVFFGTSDLSTMSSGAHLFFNVDNEPIDVTLPYYSNVKCQPILYGTTPFPAFNLAPLQPSVSLLCSFIVPANTPKDTVVGRVCWLVGAGDDFQMGYQMPVPRCRTAKKP